MYHTDFTLCFTLSPPIPTNMISGLYLSPISPTILTLQNPLPGLFLSLVLYLEVVSGALINVHRRSISPGNVKNIFQPLFGWSFPQNQTILQLCFSCERTSLLCCHCGHQVIHETPNVLQRKNIRENWCVIPLNIP